MSTPADTHAVASPTAPPFGPEEQASLDQEDAQAGKLIGRLLSFLFLYTIVVTSLVAWWTWHAIR